MSIKLDHPIIAGLHTVLQETLNCTLLDIIGQRETPGKHFAVFILKHYYRYGQRDIATAYNVNYMYVPTIVKIVSELYGRRKDIQYLVKEILNKMEVYESEADAA